SRWSRAPRNLPSFPTRRSSDLIERTRRCTLSRTKLLRTVIGVDEVRVVQADLQHEPDVTLGDLVHVGLHHVPEPFGGVDAVGARDRKSTRLNSSHVKISYAVFC